MQDKEQDYAALPDERKAFEAMMRSQTFDSLKRLSDGSYESYEARVGWMAWNVRASHGQAPAGWQDTIADVRNALADSTPSAFDNSGYREFASTVLDEVEERLTTLAAVAGPSEFLHEQMDVMAQARYKVMPPHESMFHRFAVVAGDGKRQLYIGREVECENMARKFAGAFLDGAFAFHSMLASAPTTQPAPQQEAQEPHGWLYDWTHSSATGKPDATYTAFTTDVAHASKHDNCRAVYTAPQPAPESQQDALDAARWHWLAEYLVGSRTDLDDEIVASETVNDLRNLIDAARAAQERSKA